MFTGVTSDLAEGGYTPVLSGWVWVLGVTQLLCCLEVLVYIWAEWAGDICRDQGVDQQRHSDVFDLGVE